MPRISESACWSCDEPGSAVPGKSWMRECKSCDVWWEAVPDSTRVRDMLCRQGRQLDAMAEYYGMGNRQGLLDHGSVKLSSPA